MTAYNASVPTSVNILSSLYVLHLAGNIPLEGNYGKHDCNFGSANPLLDYASLLSLLRPLSRAAFKFASFLAYFEIWTSPAMQWHCDGMELSDSTVK